MTSAFRTAPAGAFPRLVDAGGPPVAAVAAPGVHEAVLAVLPPAPASVLDIGAGPGALSLALHRRGYSVRACDLHPEDFRVPSVPCDRADLGEPLPYASGTFDAATLVEVLEHLEHPLRAVQEAVRVVRPGGVVVATTPNMQSFLARCHFLLRGNFGRWFPDAEIRGADPRPGWDHIMPIHPLAMERLIERAGADLEAVQANELVRIRGANSALSVLGKIVEVFLVPFLKPSDPTRLRGDILVFRMRRRGPAPS
jgi:SAM-dependent methyltransferase